MQGTTVAGLLLTMLAGACGGTASEEGQPNAEVPQSPLPESSAAVTLVDFEVEARPDSVPAGQVTFDVTNDGYATDEEGDPIASLSGGTHDFYALRTDLPVAELPENNVQEGIVDLEAGGIKVVGSIPAMNDGTRESVTLELEPGRYVLICNLPTHYARGMRTEFSVR